jgi:hypothetical protein
VVAQSSGREVTLDTLLTRACVSNWDRYQWFTRCTLAGDLLLCHDADDHATIERAWLPSLRQVAPSLQVQFVSSRGVAPEAVATHVPDFSRVIKKARLAQWKRTHTQGDLL